MDDCTGPLASLLRQMILALGDPLDPKDGRPRISILLRVLGFCRESKEVLQVMASRCRFVAKRFYPTYAALLALGAVSSFDHQTGVNQSLKGQKVQVTKKHTSLK
ncbi:uncharacterized protein LOC127750111 isoform X2 [Frankliniella occidentalis]|uniref:Uncharacterized protein LOC127750111 isoform X2 n=1 Tax=Frankliniella occidentalis TaxID=133901 RepID=A0A9C6UCN8_FRAOC|nr:uncharacterized protein LOC127750111 isoform X2 [Frankliniella occidentalis]